MNKIQLPTGYLFTDDYEKGQLETLSIGDYGKHVNVKANFLGGSELRLENNDMKIIGINKE